jgi:hypothetical protein
VSHNFIQINKTTNTVTVPATVLADLYAGYLMGRVGNNMPAANEIRTHLMLTISDWVNTVGDEAMIWLTDAGAVTLQERGTEVIQRERDKKEQSNESV